MLVPERAFQQFIQRPVSRAGRHSGWALTSAEHIESPIDIVYEAHRVLKTGFA